MKKFITGAVVALALAAGAPLVTSAPAAAAVDFSVNLGNAAFGYSDGYWDRDHHWHAWHNKAEADYYRTHNADHYYAYRHNKDKTMGWRDERWWDAH